MSFKQKLLKILPEIAIFLILITVGFWYILEMRTNIIKSRHQNLKDIAVISSQLIPYDLIENLDAISSDTTKNEYKELKEKLSIIIKKIDHARFCYYYTIKNNKLVFIADSEPANSKDCSPSGQIFNEADSSYYKAFLNDTIIFSNATKDRWGKWVSFFIPLHNPNTGEVKAVFGIDFEATQWFNSILKEVFVSTLLVILLLLLLLFIFIAYTKNKLLKIELKNRKLIEVALRENETKYRRISEKITDVVWLIDFNGRSLFVTPSITGFTGYTVEEYLNQTIDERFTQESALIAQQTLHKNVDIFKNNKNPDTLITIELEYNCKNGCTKWGELLLSPYLDENNNFIGFHGVTRDITKRRETETLLVQAKEQAEESNRLKSAFLSNMSHEIRTPMNGILGFANLLQKSNITKEKQQTYIDLIIKSGNRLLNIINDIVNISKIDAAQQVVYNSPTSISELCKNIYDFFLLEANQKKINFKFVNNVSQENDLINTDNDKLFAILTNLVKNSIKFTQNGFVEFGCEIENNFVKFYVKDSGIGINKNKINHIYERFWQEHIEHSASNKGSGLGLAITKAYVELLGGKISVESELNKGTTFSFTIKFEKSKLKEIEDLPTKEEHELKTNLKIILAEDDENAQTLLQAFLFDKCEEIYSVNNGLEAVELCKNTPDIDFIIMDIKMPILSGYEATIKIREFNKNVIIIAQTAFALNNEKEMFIKAGFNDYITKPYSEDAIVNLLKKWMPNK